MKKENEKLRKKLIKTGGSVYLLIPARWLHEQAKCGDMHKEEMVDLFLYDHAIVIKPVKRI